MKAIFLILAIIFTISVNGKGLKSSISCQDGCLWSDGNIWDNGNVPGHNDYVDLNLDARYTIRIDTDVSVADFQIGSNNDNDRHQILEIVSGATFTVNGRIHTHKRSIITVTEGATLVATSPSTIQGELTVEGQARFTGSEPSLLIDTKDKQITHKVNGKVTLNGGSIAVSHHLEISAVSSLVGSGSIDGRLVVKGFLKPGNDGYVGQLSLTSFTLEITAQVYIDITGNSTYDVITVANEMNQAGNVYPNLVGYTPYVSQEFPVFLHASHKGDNMLVRPEGVSHGFSNKWKQVYAEDGKTTFLHYNSASGVVFSISFIVLALLFSL